MEPDSSESERAIKAADILKRLHHKSSNPEEAIAALIDLGVHPEDAAEMVYIELGGDDVIVLRDEV